MRKKGVRNDVLSTEQRRYCMSRIRGKNTKPELIIRKALFKQGFRYRINNTKLLGKPDITLSKFKVVIFVHGCFWHGHNCHLFKWPKTNESFWRHKIKKNIERDTKIKKQLISQGWRVFTIWECALRGKSRISLDLIIESCKTLINSTTQKAEISGNDLISTIDNKGLINSCHLSTRTRLSIQNPRLDPNAQPRHRSNS